MSATKRITFKNILLFQKERSLLNPTNRSFLLKSASPDNILYPTPISQRQ